jgi:hypothetical protein
LLTNSQRRCIHDETGKIDPNKQNAPGKGETRSKRKSAASLDEEVSREGQLDDSAMDLDTAAALGDVELKHEISNSVEDSEIDPALVAHTRTPRNVSKEKTLSNGHISSTSPASATSPRQASTARRGKSATRRFTPQAIATDSPTKTSHTVRRASSMANGMTGASTSPPVSARKFSSTSPTMPQGLSPEEEASWRVAMQLQAEEFGLRSRRS